MHAATNTLLLPLHSGPHPKYNAEVLKLLQVTKGNSQRFAAALAGIRSETGLPGTLLNSLATRDRSTTFFQQLPAVLGGVGQRLRQGCSR
jgi:hypothetical protein